MSGHSREDVLHHGLRGHHLSSEEEAARADLEGKEYSFTWLHLALISPVCQHSLCCTTASQSTNTILHPPARHTVSRKNQEVTFSALKETSSRLRPVAQLLYCHYHGTSLLEGLSRTISISPLTPDHVMLHTSPTFLRIYTCS